MRWIPLDLQTASHDRVQAQWVAKIIPALLEALRGVVRGLKPVQQRAPTHAHWGRAPFVPACRRPSSQKATGVKGVGLLAAGHMNLSPKWVETLREAGFEVRHWSTIGDGRAPDKEIFEWANRNRFVVFTHDFDFSRLRLLPLRERS